jgi:hypothetical protein
MISAAAERGRKPSIMPRAPLKSGVMSPDEVRLVFTSG